MKPAPKLVPATEVTSSAGGRSLRGEVRVEGGGEGCPSDLAARLGLVPLQIPVLEKLDQALPAGCRVLRVEIPAGATVAATRYEAAGEDGVFAACEPGSACPAGGCAFPVAPIQRRGAAGGASGVLLGIFQSTATAPRSAALVVDLAH